MVTIIWRALQISTIPAHASSIKAIATVAAAAKAAASSQAAAGKTRGHTQAGINKAALNHWLIDMAALAKSGLQVSALSIGVRAPVPVVAPLPATVKRHTRHCHYCTRIIPNYHL
jgi:hypothetical protein